MGARGKECLICGAVGSKGDRRCPQCGNAYAMVEGRFSKDPQVRRATGWW